MCMDVGRHVTGLSIKGPVMDTASPGNHPLGARWLGARARALILVALAAGCATVSSESKACDAQLSYCPDYRDTRQVINVDVSSGAPVIAGATQFARLTKARVVFYNLNPFRYDYTFTKSEQADAVAAAPIVQFLTMANIPTGEATQATGNQQKTPESDVTLSAHVANFSGDFLRGGAAQPVPKTKAVRCAVSTSDVGALSRRTSDLKNKRDSLGLLATAALNADSDRVRNLLAIRTVLHHEQEQARVLLHAASVLDTLQRARDILVSKAVSDTVMAYSLRATSNKLSNDFLALGQAALSACKVDDIALKTLAQDVAHIAHDDIDAILATYHVIVASNDNWIRDDEDIVRRSSGPFAFVNDSMTVGGYEVNTTVAIKVHRIDRDAKATSDTKSDSPVAHDNPSPKPDGSTVSADASQTVHFGVRSRWSLAAGPAYSNINNFKYDRVSGLPDSAHRTSSDSVKSIIGRTDQSTFRVGPAAFIHYRISDFHLGGLPMSVLASLGVGTTTKGESAELGYMPGVSLALDDEWIFSTGLYYTHVDELIGNLRLNEPVPAGLTGPIPTASRTRANVGFAISFKLK